MKETRDVIVELMRNIGGRKEVELYLKHYASLDSQKFGIIKIDGAVLRDSLETAAASLAFLHRVGLYPIVVHGAGAKLDQALSDAGHPIERVEGIRVTPPAALEIVRRVSQDLNLRLVEALEAHGCGARPIASGVFTAEPLDPDKLGMVGRISGVDDAAVLAAIRAGKLPILTALGATEAGQLYNVSADEAARALAQRFEPHKIIFLTEKGGLSDRHGRLINAINLREDFARLMKKKWVTDSMRRKLNAIRAMLEQLPLHSSVSITAPEALAKELFTDSGAGTLVRLGERVKQYPSFEGIDRERLRGLLESSFGRTLKPTYFDDRKCLCVYLSEQYRATAILTVEGELPYLDKFAVTKKAQGEGLAGSLWARMRGDHPKLFWRSRTENEICSWYFQQSQGSYRTPEWTVFWYGLEGFGEIQRCVETALALPATMIDG